MHSITLIPFEIFLDLIFLKFRVLEILNFHTYACSTNVFFSFTEVRKLASYSKLFEIRHSVLDGLVDIAQKYHPDNLRHVPSIMLLLTHIRQAAERATSYFLSLKKEGSVTFCDLLSEMLEAQSTENKKHGSPTSNV